MKTYIKIALLWIIIAAIAYLLGVFVTGDFNTNHWDMGAKGVAVFIYVFVCASITGFILFFE